MNRHARHSAVSRTLLAFGLAVVVGASGAIAGSVAVAAERLSGPAGGLRLAGALASVVPVGSLMRVIGNTQAVDDGNDGRLTFLLLGSDTRGGGVGRTDSIIIMSIKNGTNTINAASIPRDTARILNPFTPDPNDTFKPRVNAILKSIKSSGGLTTQQALDKFEEVIEKLLGTPANPIEIDYVALITFVGFNALVDQVDPISINISNTVKDGKFWDDPNLPKGVYFPAANNYQLWRFQPGPPLTNTTNGTCNGLWKTAAQPPASQYWCRSALPFVRSRKGTGNSDFKRARRQQDFVGAAISRVINMGSGAALTSLVGAAGNQQSNGALYTDFPITGPDAISLFNTLDNASLVNQVVFAPSTYSTHIPGTTAYQLKLDAVRAWADTYLR